MPDDFTPISPAQALYGPSGPLNGPDPAASWSISQGIAKPAADQAKPAPLFGNDNRASPAPAPPGSEAFDPGRVALPEGYEAGATMGEFAGLAREAGLNQSQGEAFLQLHQKDVAAQHEQVRAAWQATTERAFGDRLHRVVDDIQTAVGDDDDAKRFYQMLSWSGLEYEPSVLRVLHRLARRY